MATRQLPVRLAAWSAVSAFLLLGLCYLFPPSPRGNAVAEPRSGGPAPAVNAVLAGGASGFSNEYGNARRFALEKYLDSELSCLRRTPQRTLSRVEDCMKRLPGSSDKDRVIAGRFAATRAQIDGILQGGGYAPDPYSSSVGEGDSAGENNAHLKSLLLAEYILIRGLQAESHRVALTARLASHRLKAEGTNKIGADWDGIPSVDKLRREADQGLLTVYAAGEPERAARPVLPWLLERARQSGVVFLLSALFSGVLATLGEVAVRRLAARRLLLKRTPRRSAAIAGRVPGADGGTDRSAKAAVA